MRSGTLWMIGGGLAMCAASLAFRFDVFQTAPVARASGGGAELELRLAQPLLGPGDASTHARVAITAPPSGARVPVRMALAVDVSGSMAGDKLANARAAAHRLVDRIQPGDRVVIVPFAGRGSEALWAEPTADRAALHAAIDRLEIAGGTCIECGLSAAFGALERAGGAGERRVILLSDGEANEGLTGAALAEWARGRRADASITSIGLGASFDEATMSAIAREGGGAFYFVHHSAVIDSVLERELARLSNTVASGGTLRLRAEGARFAPSDGWVIAPSRREASIDLGALHASETQAFFVPVVLEGSAAAVAATLELESAGGAALSLAAEARLERTGDPARALASRDSGIAAELERRRSAITLDAAVARFLSGDGAGAVGDLRAEAARLRALATETPELAEEADEVLAVAGSLEGRDTSDRAAVGSCLFEQARAAELREGLVDPYHERGMYDLAVTE